MFDELNEGSLDEDEETDVKLLEQYYHNPNPSNKRVPTRLLRHAGYSFQGQGKGSNKMKMKGKQKKKQRRSRANNNAFDEVIAGSENNHYGGTKELSFGSFFNLSTNVRDAQMLRYSFENTHILYLLLFC